MSAAARWLLVLAGLAIPAWAQTAPEGPAELEHLVQQGQTAALEARLQGRRGPRELALLARAYANRAAGLSGTQRQEAFQTADKLYQAWAQALAGDGARSLRSRADLAQALAERADMILRRWAAEDLDEFELTAGNGPHRTRLASLLRMALDTCAQAAGQLRPLLGPAQDEQEEQLMLLGLYDPLRRLKTAVELGSAWAELYLAQVDPGGEAQRRELLNSAQRRFEALLAGPVEELLLDRARLGLAIAWREAGRFDHADRQFRQIVRETVGLTQAQARCEWARCHLAAGKFEEARLTLAPLVEKDPQRLSGDDAAIRFYINLAHLWDARSYLLEAAALRAAAPQSPAQEAVLARARRAREIGVSRLSRLAGLSPRWSEVVRVHLSTEIDPDAPPESQTPAELLFSARQLLQSGRVDPARARLEALIARPGVEKGPLGEALFELGRLQYERGELAAAAETFHRLASELKDHPQAPQAITGAYQSAARQAGQSRDRGDFQRLARILLTLVQSFPEHELRPQAVFWLPVALQAAGDSSGAAEQFGKVPREHPRWAEAQYRRLECLRAIWSGESGAPGPAERQTRLRGLAEDALRLAGQIEAADQGGAADRWAGAARLLGAELLGSPPLEDHPGVLRILQDFERRCADGALRWRALKLRVRAHQALGELERAARLVQESLRDPAGPDQIDLLATLAGDLQNEVERLDRQGQSDAARELAGHCVALLERLDRLVGPQDETRGRAVRYGLARMRLAAGQIDLARAAADELLRAEPASGAARRLHALALTAGLGQSPDAEALRRAREAWEGLLRDPHLRQAAPDVYWEARYHFLSLLVREGRAAEVVEAIRQERIWRPQMGDAPWKERFDRLEQQALRQAGQGP